jgi:hypothetical protein
MKQRVILHSLFRAGSTFFFNKYRNLENHICFYEPFHHDLVKIRRNKIQIWDFDEKYNATKSQDNIFVV